MQSNPLKWCAALPTLLAVAACGPGTGQQTPEAETPASPPSTATVEANSDTESLALMRSQAPSDARVYFIKPLDGDVVSNPVAIEFAVAGMELVPAGQAAAGSGHHHILIDAALPAMSLPIPADENHVHFGDGSSATELTLLPGQHTLQLLFADHLHIPHDPPVYSEVITITVE